MDIVYIRDLRVDTIIGIYDWERRVRQTLLVDLEMATDVQRAAGTGSLVDAIDYKAVADHSTAFIQAGEFELLESLAEALAATLQKEFGISWLRVRVGKPGAVTAAGDVGVVIERGQ
jgi:dihydroneopterin aldolase